MLNCASAYTYKTDAPEAALSEIKTQLEKITLLEHSAGIVMCHPEFISTGVLEHICDNLPFDIAGVTTASQAVNGEAGEFILTVFVMTSDDVRFKTGVTGSLNESIDGPVKTAYEKTTAGETEQPKLAFLFPPLFLEKYSGDAFVSAWKKIIPGTPYFGTLAIDDTLSFNDSETIYNGVNEKDSMPFVLCYGNINPRFIIATLPENNALPISGEVTKSSGNMVYEINNKNAREFFSESYIPGSILPYMPFMINFLKRDDHDNVPVIREHIAFTDDGTAIFGGDVDEGSTFSLLKFDSDDILPVSRREMNKINSMPDVNGALLFSCVSRRISLFGASKPMEELQTALDSINPDIPFMLGYAGGEFCPTSVNDGIPTNRFHNFSLVILVV